MIIKMEVKGMILMLFILAGCNSDDPLPSAEITTAELFPVMRSVQYEDGSVLTTVELHDFADNYIYLSGGDQLLSSLNTSVEQLTSFDNNLFSNALVLSNNVKILQQRDLVIDDLFFLTVINGTPEYYVLDNADGITAPAQSFVTFNRNNHQSATDSFVELPPDFSILNPSSYSSISRSGSLVLTWSDFDNVSVMKLDVGAVCDDVRYTASLNFGIVNTGSVVLNSADYFPVAPLPTSNCSVSFLLKRQSLGFVSTAFGGGSFVGIQQRTVQFTSTP